jgi:BCD family chlorophyll transporter-like MFS transporter
VWTFLLLGYAVGGPVFGILLPSSEGAESGGLRFSPDTLQNLFIIAAVVLAALWFFSLLGEERRAKTEPVAAPAPESAPKTSLLGDLRLAWSHRQTRLFFWYLALSMLFAFSQDLILEPFAGDVFGMEARVTTRFSGYWGSMAILGSVLCLWLSRRYKRLNNTVMSVAGVAVLVVAFTIFAASSLAEIRGLVTPGLIVLGVGLGVWEIGTLGNWHAGADDGDESRRARRDVPGRVVAGGDGGARPGGFQRRAGARPGLAVDEQPERRL